MKRLYIATAFLLCLITTYAIQPQKGYRGFVESSNYLDLDFSFLSGGSGSSRMFTGLNTTHGYQFNNWLFVGGGVGFEYNLDWKSDRNNDGEPHYVIPLYAEGRLDAKWGKFTPYFSARLGGNLADHGGIYFSPTIGYRINWGRKTAINLGLGASIIGMRNSYHEHIMHPEGGITLGDLIYYQGHEAKFTVRVGFEF